MRTHLTSDGRAFRRGDMRLMAMSAAVLAALVLAGAGAGCGGDDEGNGEGGGACGAVAEATGLMPASAIGMVHLDVAKTRDDITAAAEKNKDKLGPMLAFLEPLKKIDSADLYLLPGGKEPMPLVAVRGTLGPDDIKALLEQTPMKGAELKKGDNGRYTIANTPLMMIVGSEANDVPAGVVLAGMAPMLTDEFVAALGKEKNARIVALLAKVDTKAQIWGCADVPPNADKDAPKQVYGSINVTGDKPLDVSMVFDDEAKAAKTINSFDQQAPAFMKEIIALKRDGATVNVTMIGEGSLIDNVIKIFLGMMKDSMSDDSAREKPAP